MCVELLYVSVCAGAVREEAPRILNQKQERHTKMWGTKLELEAAFTW